MKQPLVLRLEERRRDRRGDRAESTILQGSVEVLSISGKNATLRAVVVGEILA